MTRQVTTIRRMILALAAAVLMLGPSSMAVAMARTTHGGAPTDMSASCAEDMQDNDAGDAPGMMADCAVRCHAIASVPGRLPAPVAAVAQLPIAIPCRRLIAHQTSLDPPPPRCLLQTLSIV